MEKKLRFGDLVRNSGRPQVLTLWIKPEKDKRLTEAVEENRVLTVIQEPGKRDYGRIGLEVHPGAAYLVFPNSLPKEPATRVIGLNYQLLDVPTADHIQPAKGARQPPAKQEFQPVIWKPRQRSFKVRVRRTATFEDEITVRALDQTAAEQQALERVKHKPFKRAVANVKAEVVKAE